MNSSGTNVWLNPTILEWDITVESTSIHERSEWIRSHELWTHAERRFKDAETPDDRSDVISILRRVLNHRLSKMKSLYLEDIPLIKKPAGTIQQLALLGAVKP